MTTPVGWARAMLWYSHARFVPHYGSLLEYVFLVVQQYHMRIEQLRTMTLAQAAADGTKAADAFSQYKMALNHINEKERKEALQEALNIWTSTRAVQFSTGIPHEDPSTV
ncbi:hypothetical protein EBT31_06060 [bacterium]|nr:hypothetical protein [bacterium]